jgi:hypothetical protein
MQIGALTTIHRDPFKSMLGQTVEERLLGEQEIPGGSRSATGGVFTGSGNCAFCPTTE